MTVKYLIALAALPLALSACTKVSDEGEDGFEMSVDLGDEDGEISKIKIGGDGEEANFSIKADGFAFDIDIPAIELDSDDFDLNNVALYPGTKITGLNVEDMDDGGGKVSLSFVAPTSADKLATWYETKMKAEHFVVAKSGNSLSGTTDEGDPFSLELNEKSAEETAGTLEFSEQ